MLSDNATQFTSKFFQKVCCILGIRNVFTATYHHQNNVQMERLNKKLLSALQNYIGDHSRDSDLFSDAATYAYNTHGNTTKSIAPFQLVLSKTRIIIALQSEKSLEDFKSLWKYYLKWQSWLHILMEHTNKSLGKEKASYERNFGTWLHKPKYEIPMGSYDYFRKEQGTIEKPKHKQS